MKIFFIKVLYFSLPILLFFIALEICLRNDNNSYYALKKKALIQQIDSCKVLVLGSSSENSGINPAYFDLRGINLAFVGGTSLDVFYLLILKYLPKMPYLEKVIIPISTFTLFATEEREEMKFRKILLNKYFGLYENDFNSLLPKSLVLNTGLKNSIGLLFNKQSSNIDKYGFDHCYGSVPDGLTDDYGKKTVIRHIGNNVEDLKGSVFYKNSELLDSIIIFLKKRNIRVYLITTPTHKSYYKNLDGKVFEIINPVINNLIQKYNIEYFNFLKDNRFNDNDFYNCDHLNVDGAEKFSKILNEEVICRN